MKGSCRKASTSAPRVRASVLERINRDGQVTHEKPAQRLLISAPHEPGIIRRVLWGQPPLIIPSLGRHYSHLTKEESDAQKGRVTCPRSHTQLVAEPGLVPKTVPPEPVTHLSIPDEQQTQGCSQQEGVRGPLPGCPSQNSSPSSLFQTQGLY